MTRYAIKVISKVINPAHCIMFCECVPASLSAHLKGQDKLRDLYPLWSKVLTDGWTRLHLVMIFFRLFGNDNQTFDWKSGDDNFTRSNSFANALVEARHENLAKINKKPGTSTLNNVPPPQVPNGERWPYQLPIPRIPTPDYSPVNRPGYQKPLKSVLKTRTSALYGPSSSTKF